VCSDQLQFRRWKDDAWLDWLPPRLLSKAASNITNLTTLQEAVRASAASGSRVSYSDAVRFLVLHKFGGIYTDGDVLHLRNLEAFAHYDFVYEWSFVQNGVNTAVFGAAQNSTFTGAVIQAALSVAVTVNATTGNVTFDARKFNSVFHPMAVLRRIPPKIAARVEALPSIPFDPLWLTVDTPKGKTHNLTIIHKLRAWKDFFEKPKSYIVPPAVPTDVFKGAFTHHWHNTWSVPFVESSFIGQLVSTYDRFLQGQQPNPYGLTAVPCSAAVRPTLRRQA
jgi:WD repeat and SOF domain-containing protein 1